jgi:hypothetical protein
MRAAGEAGFGQSLDRRRDVEASEAWQANGRVMEKACFLNNDESARKAEKTPRGGVLV